MEMESSDEEFNELELFRKESMKLLDELIKQELGQHDVADSVKVLNNWDPSTSKKQPKRKTPAKRKVFRPRLSNLFPQERRKSSRLAKKEGASYTEMDIGEENKENKPKEVEVFKRKRTRTTCRRVPPRPLPVSIINEDYIAKISYQVSSKVHCSAVGTCCHQCRQKTKDSKTICKSGHCVGVRGQFCGVCLLNRYGENAEEALRNPKWSCPPCRNICNCSICRNRQGMRPTGIMTPLAQAQGHKSVKDYLNSLKGLDEKVNKAQSIEYSEKDVLGFTEQGDVLSIPGEEDDVMGFDDDGIALLITRMAESIERDILALRLREKKAEG